MEPDVRELLRRAGAPQGKAVGVPAAKKERRYVFGDTQQRPSGSPTGQPPRNRRVIRRRVSTFTIIVTLFGSGLAILLYVNNILRINQLAADVGVLQTRYDAVMNANAALRAEVNRKSAWERIGGVATGQLGLAFPTEQPSALVVDRDLLEKLQRP